MTREEESEEPTENVKGVGSPKIKTRRQKGVKEKGFTRVVQGTELYGRYVLLRMQNRDRRS